MHCSFIRASTFTMLALLCFVFAGCSGDRYSGEIRMPDNFSIAGGSEPERIPVDIYWDATYSMQGYATLTGGNVYRTLPDHLGDMGDSMGEVKFFRFGAEVKPLSGREYRKFSDPAYYDEVVTAMHNVIDVADASHLSVIVTDLFESDADWSNVTKKLKGKYFAKHMAVAVIGIKNPFRGDIFDVGLNAAKYFYDSGSDPAKYRPFYLFVMGPDGKVKEFLERWKDRQELPNETGYILLSEQLLEKTADLSSMELKGGKNILLDERLGLKDKRMKEFGIKEPGETSELVVSFKYEPALGICPMSPKDLNLDLEVYTLSPEGTWEKSEPDTDAKLDIREDGENEGAYLASFSFTPTRTLTPGKINMIHAGIVPSKKGYRLPDWVKKWSMANVDVSPEQFDGSKTINFYHVIESLKDSSMAAARPTVVNMDMVFDLQ